MDEFLDSPESEARVEGVVTLRSVVQDKAIIALGVSGGMHFLCVIVYCLRMQTRIKK